MSCEVECSVSDYLKDANDFPEWLLWVFISVWTPFRNFLPAYQSRWEQAKQSRSSVLPKHVLKLFLGDCKASPDHMRVPSPLKGILTFGHAQNTSAGTYLGCILIRCPNHLIWLIPTQKSSGSSPAPKDKLRHASSFWQLESTIPFFWSLFRSHDQRWWMECRAIGKSSG